MACVAPPAGDHGYVPRFHELLGAFFAILMLALEGMVWQLAKCGANARICRF